MVRGDPDVWRVDDLGLDRSQPRVCEHAVDPADRRDGRVGEAVAGADRGEGVGSEALHPLPGRRGRRRVHVSPDDQRRVVGKIAFGEVGQLVEVPQPRRLDQVQMSAGDRERRAGQLQDGDGAAAMVQVLVGGEGKLVAVDDLDGERGQHQVGAGGPAAGDPHHAGPAGQRGALGPPAQEPRGLLDDRHIRGDLAHHPAEGVDVVAHRSDVVGQDSQGCHVHHPGSH